MYGGKRVAVIVVAAGKGERAAPSGDDTPKQYRLLAGTPLLARTLAALFALSAIDTVVPVIHPEHGARYAALGLADPKLLPPVSGGAERQASVRAGLEALVAISPELVLIHDAARPFVTKCLVIGVLAALTGHDGALPVLALTDTIKRSQDGRVVDGTEDRHTLFAAQTPQGFLYPKILEAHRRAAAAGKVFTDDAGIAEWAGLSVALAPGSSRNIKITLPEDFARAERLLEDGIAMETRIGTGFDVHPFAAGDFVTLGGIRIPHHHGLAGHSDADVVLHALTDAIYGALGEGDIGTHFPPSDPQWRGADSALFLRHAVGLVGVRGGRIVNLDLTLVCEAPRISPYVTEIRGRIAEICAISVERVAVKATTSERLGFTGREEGIVALATASIEMPREAGET
jgi:2-C-methyl-D-erythritol 4-phosphate cytidylyltransferase/2-C-methyl-D-erythritol 2,4-cyclodiphosphate synthase